VVPVLVGTGAAWHHPSRPCVGPAGEAGCSVAVPRVDPHWCALAALVVALAIQVGTNYANDYADGVRGTDEHRVGPLRLVASGLATPAAVKRAALGAFGLAGVVGLWLAWATSWWVVLVGAACMLAGWLYTGGPRPYGYIGLGEVFVFVFFGLVATAGTFYVQTLRLDVAVVWVAAAMVGLLATALLVANNLRDIATDAVSGKHTLAVRLGRRRAGRLDVACLLLPFVGVVLWTIAPPSGPAPISHRLALALPLLALPLAVPLVRTVLGRAEGGELLPVLAGTARLQLVFGILLAVALAWSFW
jgi:1,4-dihydroxy-2-naphthoate polyprenyltransferase